MSYLVSGLTNYFYTEETDQVYFASRPAIDSAPTIYSLDFWKARAVQVKEFVYKNEQISNVVWNTLGILTAVAAGSFASMGLLGMKVGIASYASTFIPFSLIISSVCFWMAANIEHNRDEKRLNEIRRQTIDLPLRDVLRTYDWDQIFSLGIYTPDEFGYAFRKHVENLSLLETCSLFELVADRLSRCRAKYSYTLPSLEEFRNKWRSETTIKSFEQIVAEYPLEKLEHYKIIKADEMSIIREINSFYKQIKNQFESQKEKIDEIGVDKSSFQRELEAGYTQIEQSYDQNSPLKRLGACDTNYHRSRDELIDRCEQRKVAAYAQCSAVLREARVRTADRLQPNLRAVFDQRFAQFLDDSHAIEVQKETALKKLRAHYEQERENLSQEIVEQNKQRAIQKQTVETSLKGKYATVSSQTKLGPIAKRFQDNVEELNLQFEIRRRMLRI